ncbi:MAG: tRNA preQ1(34) S-adenosylmethionine ribosyltransferase-isomerase QueA [Sphingomonadales bacterium]
MRVDLFDFHLPQERIALAPIEPRDQARMLVVNGATGLQDAQVSQLPDLLQPGDILVVNDTKVIPARLKGIRGQARVEITLHKRESANVWRAFVKNAKRLRVGDDIHVGDDMSAHVLDKAEGGEITLRLDCADGVSVEAALQLHGVMPLPPYIASQRSVGSSDNSDYQTIYAQNSGAVAAPTAGLHFTPDLFKALEERGVERLHLTLHVGAGTFLPVKVEDTRDHVMHEEWGELSAHAAEKLNTAKAEGRRIVAVGTTSLRLLESATGEDGVVRPFSGDTDIFITPGYKFRAVDVLMTNFHLPKSTLFMLVSAFSGLDTMRSAYEHAIASGYRFYSYGDACLLHRNEGI